MSHYPKQGIPTEAYEELMRWKADTANTLEELNAWKERHPDWQTDEYEYDQVTYQAGIGIVDVWESSGRSTFDPDDPMPNAHGKILTTETMLALITVALDAYRKATEQ